MERAQAPNNYTRRSCYVPRVWGTREQLVRSTWTLERSEHRLRRLHNEGASASDFKRMAPPTHVIDDAVHALRSESFVETVASIRPGREAVFFTSNATVSRLVRAVRKAGADGKPEIEVCLDTLFADFRAGEVFAHTEVVMAILFALKTAEVPYAADVLGVFTNSETVEIGPVRRFARTLVAR